MGAMTAGQQTLLAALPHPGAELDWRDAFRLGLSTAGTTNAVAALMRRGVVTCDSYTILRIT